MVFTRPHAGGAIKSRPRSAVRGRPWALPLLLLLTVAGPRGQGGGLCHALLTCQARADGCGCDLSDGRGTLDLTSLSNSDGTARFNGIAGSDNTTYSYNPCGTFNLLNCTDAAVCQVRSDGKTSTQTGDSGTARWKVQNDSQVYIYYEHLVQGPPLHVRQNFITLFCDPKAEAPSVNLTGSDATEIYYFTLVSKCACPNGCSGGNKGHDEPESLSGGTVFLIVCAVLLAVYLLGGMTYKRLRYGSQGLQMLPNYDFWTSLPSTVRGGILFLTCRRKRNYDDVS